ncbi:MAG: hypothetical protein Q8P13_04600 [bacterium]|nr:hypothetical protein [bacterium]
MEPQSVRLLKWVYLIVFLTASAAVALLTIFDGTYFSSLRFSNVAIFYPGESVALAAFRFLTGFYLLLIFIDTVALFNYRSVVLREISSIASLVGFLLMGAAVVSLGLVFAGFQSVDTGLLTVILLYLVIGMGLFLLDILTFFVEEQGLLDLSLLGRGKHKKG